MAGDRAESHTDEAELGVVRRSIVLPEDVDPALTPTNDQTATSS